MCWVYTGHLQTVGHISVGSYFLKGCTVSFKVRMESNPQTTSCRLMLSVQTEYPTCGVSVGIQPLFHQYATENTTYSRLVHFSTVRMTVSEMFVKVSIYCVVVQESIMNIYGLQ